MIFCSESSTMSSDMVCWWRSQLVLGWYCEFRNKKRERQKKRKKAEKCRGWTKATNKLNIFSFIEKKNIDHMQVRKKFYL